jgi:hypothetical protein
MADAATHRNLTRLAFVLGIAAMFSLYDAVTTSAKLVSTIWAAGFAVACLLTLRSRVRG